MQNRVLPHHKAISHEKDASPSCSSHATPRDVLRRQHVHSNTTHTDLDRLQMDRLAQALLSKDQHDLAALSAANPDLMEEWHQAFKQLRNETERTARVWAAAAAVLASAKGLPEVNPRTMPPPQNR